MAVRDDVNQTTDCPKSATAGGRRSVLTVVEEAFRRVLGGRQIPMTEGWPDTNPRLTAACARLAPLRAEDALLRVRFQELATANTYDAMNELDQVRARLDVLAVEIPVAERDVSREAEIETIVRELWPQHATRYGLLQKWLEQAVMNPDALSRDEWLTGVRLNREVDRLRLVLRDATGDEEFARPFDAITQLRDFWESVEKDRSQLIASVGPGYKAVQLGPLPWFSLADRLATLRAGTARKEAIHAVR